MKEGLVARIGRIISGSANNIVDSIENAAPEMVMEEAIREIEGATDDVRAELGRHEAEKHLASRQLQRISEEHEALTEQIRIALDEGREDLAEVAVERQMDLEAQIPVLEKSVADHNDNIQDLNNYIHALKAKRREMQEALTQFRQTIKHQSDSQVSSTEDGNLASRRAEKAESAFERIMSRNGGLPPGAGSADAAKLAELEELSRKNKIRERLAQIKAQG